MGIFKGLPKNDNEVNYVNGKKHFIDIIKNRAPEDSLMFKAPEEDFNTNSKLEVMPGETAIFVKEGNIVQEFTSGTYTLSTNNYPFLSRIINASSGGISTFNCVIYFFRSADSKELRWGSASPITAKDNVYNIYTEIKARGSYKIRITNPRLFLEKLIGSNVNITTQENLYDYFSLQIQTEARSTISTFLNDYDKELIGLDAYLSDISKKINPEINKIFESYGLYCVNFNIVAMDVDRTNYNKLNEAQIESISRMKQGQGEAAYIQSLGNDWEKLQTANILNNIAQNAGAGSLGALSAGLGVGTVAGSAIGQMASNMLGNQSKAQENISNNVSSLDDSIAILEKVKGMLDAGLISNDEYEAKKKEILSRI